MKQSPPSSQPPSGGASRNDFEALYRELTLLGLDLDEQVVWRLLDYWAGLKRASAQLNLISQSTIKDGLIRHVADALLPLKGMIPPGPQAVLDLGSGGGLPGIPLALAREDLTVTLLEARERKTDWLIRVIRELGVDGRVSVLWGRFEEQPVDRIRQFQLITARAVAPPQRLLKMVLPDMAEGARLLLWHSKQQEDQIRSYKNNKESINSFMVDKTLSHTFESTKFSSCLSSILRER